jgi:nicotinamidase-related amidase
VALLNGHDRLILWVQGTELEADAYSAFDGRPHPALRSMEGQAAKSPLSALLRQHSIERVFVAGLATDFCVKATALSAVREGFETLVVLDASRGISDVGTRRAAEALEAEGCRCVSVDEALSLL